MNGGRGQGRALTALRELLGAGCGRGKLAGGPGASGSSGSSLCRAPRRWGHQEGIELDGKQGQGGLLGAACCDWLLGEGLAH